LELGMNEQAIIERLKKISLFRGLVGDPERLAKLARIVSWRQSRAGDQVIREAEEGSELYVLNKGVVNVVKRTLAEETYTIVTLREDEDAFFGELALMDREVRSASVVATTDCEFLVITKEDFLRLGNEDPWLGLQVTREIGEVLSRRLRKTSEDMVMLFEALVGQVAESGGLEGELGPEGAKPDKA
jgi:CRP/FNR family cyclic AMP-dependent transcriptional regulator